MRKWLMWVVLSSGILIGIIICYTIWSNRRFENSKEAKFITTSPIDLSQINRISQFRSCMGHDYSGKNIRGETDEPVSSMKHYVEPLKVYAGKSDQVKIFAPFDGKVVVVKHETDGGITLAPGAYPSWTLEIGHISPLATIKAGDTVTSGDHVGYAYSMPGGSSFDIALWDGGNRTNPYLGFIDTFINHMIPSVADEYAAHDLTPATLILTKEFRTAHACPIDYNAKSKKPGDEKVTEANFVQVENDEGLMVKVKH